MKKFRAPKKSLAGLDADAAGQLLAAAADLTLIVDRRGVVRDIAFGSDELAGELGTDWIGRAWNGIADADSRPKIDAMVSEPEAHGARARQVNYRNARGRVIPVLHQAVPLADSGRIVVLGRDLRPLESLQQRLLEVQQSMEREYARVRHAETRYRLLFQLASEAVLIVDAATRRIVEANPAALDLLGTASRRLIGRSFPEGFDAEGSRAVERLLAAAQATGRGEEARATLLAAHKPCLVSASLFRQDEAVHLLIRLRPVEGTPALNGSTPAHSLLLEVLERSPDGLVITDPQGAILSANAAFLDIAQLATLEQARGQPLDRWLGRPGVDLRVLIGNLRQHGAVRLFPTTVKGEHGIATEVEVSAVASLEAEPPCLGFTVRNVEKRAVPAGRAAGELPRSAQELTELIGRMSLKDLVRETTDVIERMCIEAALQLTNDNRATAAEMLGLSRQSLYAKLRRYGLGDLDGVN